MRRRDDSSDGRTDRFAERDHDDSTLRRRRTASGLLLDRAIATLGATELASILNLTPQDVERMAAEGQSMSLRQQRILALAVLTLSENHPGLRRRATSLLGQVRACEAFEAGLTQRHAEPPPRMGW
jgi:hypothetical protein